MSPDGQPASKYKINSAKLKNENRKKNRTAEMKIIQKESDKNDERRESQRTLFTFKSTPSITPSNTKFKWWLCHEFCMFIYFCNPCISRLFTKQDDDDDMGSENFLCCYIKRTPCALDVFVPDRGRFTRNAHTQRWNGSKGAWSPGTGSTPFSRCTPLYVMCRL